MFAIFVFVVVDYCLLACLLGRVLFFSSALILVPYFFFCPPHFYFFLSLLSSSLFTYSTALETHLFLKVGLGGGGWFSPK